MSEDTNKRGNRKERVGVVVSDVQDKTIVVEVQRRTPHPLYKKVVSFKKRITNFFTHCFHECVSHTATDDECINFFEEIVDNRNFGRYF